jgi:AraC-like DNA-binding protein
MITETTDDIRPTERAEFWADLVSRNVTPVRVEPAGARPLRGELRAHSVAGLGIAEVSGAGLRAVHAREHVANASTHVYAACVHLEGEARLCSGSRTVTLQPGDVFLTDSRQPFTFELDGPWRHLDITVPVHWLDSRVARPEALSGTVVRGRPLARLWSSHLAAGFAAAEALSVDAGALFARQSLELLSQLLDESGGERVTPVTPSEAARAAIFTRACGAIALDCGNPDLTPADVARAVGVSSRTLARAFAAHGESVMRRVLDERVRQAARLLRSRAHAHRSVTEIAFRCGFNDLSHFGRVFAGRMHVTPSAWRRDVPSSDQRPSSSLTRS